MNRIDPLMPAALYKTFAVRAPRDTHWRPGTCEEAGCPDYSQGWRTTVDEATELGQKQAHYIRHDRTRKAAESRTEAGLTVFTFGPGQKCFRGHRVRIQRPEVFIERGGDHRGNPRGERRVHVSSDDWVDSFANHQDKLADRFRQG